jgi:hypothetical protein
MSTKKLYLLLAIAGAVIPYLFLVQYFADAGLSPTRFIDTLFANGAVGGFTADLLISSLAFWIFMFHRSANGEGPKPFWFIVINLTIGLSCALPAYLYKNEGSRPDVA